MGDFLYGRCSRGLRGIRLRPLKFHCALLVFKHVMGSYVIEWRGFINNYRFLGQNMIKKVWSFIFCIAKPALLINKEWLFYINYCVIVSKQTMMSIIAYNINRLFYKNPPTCSNRHVRRLFRCSDSPNVEARVSGILVGTSNKFYCNHTSEYNS